MQTITPCLWFDGDAEEAAELYISLFDNSGIKSVARYGEGAPFPAGTALTVDFVLDGQGFQGLNGGPEFPFTEAISLSVRADTQERIDFLWESLLADGGVESQCGWLKDRYGLSWQIVPPILSELLSDSDPEASGRTMAAMLKMVKLDIAALQAAHDG